MGKRSYLLLIPILGLVMPMTSRAQTTTDLYTKLSVPGQTQYQQTLQQLADAKSDYTEKESEYVYAVNYNAVIDSLDTDTLKQQLDALNAQRDAVLNELSVNGYNLSIKDIKDLYSQYKSLCGDIETTQKRYDNYSSRSKLSVPNYDFTTMEENISNIENQANAELANSDIGDIDDLVNFVQTPYCVKVAFDGTGTTLKTKEDTGVLSLFGGTVTYADKDQTSNEVVVVDCGDGIQITYRNLKARYVQTGDAVTQYQKIATTKTDLYITIQIGDNFYDVNKLYGGK